MHAAPSSLAAHIHQAALHHKEAADGFFQHHTDALVALAKRVHTLFTENSTLLICGNGGSACDAMHIAGEFSGRFECERRGLPAIALSADSGVITAVGNDYGFERVFARQVEALGKPGDMLIALSTSGSSPNILAALATAREQKLHTVLLTGEKGQGQTAYADELFVVPSTNTARTQEIHMLALHMLAGLVETMIVEEA